MKKKISLLFLSLLLVGCNGQSETDKLPSESVVPPTDKTTTTTPAYTVDLSDIITELSFGFSGSTLFKSGYDILGFNENYHDFKIGDNVYEFKTYNSADEGKATKSVVKNSGQYAPYDEEKPDSSYLCINELELNNEVEKYYITDGTNYLKWKTAGYFNPFSELFADDFIADKTNPYDFHLNTSETTSKEGLTALATSLTGQIGLEIKDFTLKTDGISATGYDITFQPVQSSYGQLLCSATGEILEKGTDPVTKITPIDGTEIEELDAAIKKYQTLSYRVDATLSNKLLKAEVCQNGLIYDFYHLNGKKYANYGYYQKGKNVQGITKIGDAYYEEGTAIANSVFSQIVATMKISSVFFTEAEGSTPEKRIYKFNDEYKDVVTRNPDTFAILKGSVVGDLSIIVEQDKLTFENEFSGNTKEIYTYYDAGKVKDFTTAIYEDCSALTWSELLSNQPADLEKFYSGTITKEYLDQIPVIGGKRSLAVLNFNIQRGDLAQVLFSISDYNDGLSLISEYEKVMETNGYTKTEKQSKTKDVIFEKEITANGVKKTASVEVILGADYFTTPTIVFYFKLK